MGWELCVESYALGTSALFEGLFGQVGKDRREQRSYFVFEVAVGTLDEVFTNLGLAALHVLIERFCER